MPRATSRLVLLIDDELIEQFRTALGSRRSESTVANYLGAVRQLVLYLTVELERPPRLDDLCHERVQGWLDRLPHAPPTIAVKRHGILKFSSYLRKRKLPVPELLAEDLEVPEIPARLPSFLSNDQAEALLGAPLLRQRVGIPRVLQLRDVAILQVLLAGGLRRCELCGLNMDRLWLNTPRRGAISLKLIGKRKRERFVPIAGRAAEALLAYLAERHTLCIGDPKDEPAVFLTQERTRLSSRQLYRLVHSYGTRVDLVVWPHLLRHTCATMLLARGCELREIQVFLGHSQIQTTTIYAHLDTNRLYDSCTARHPLTMPLGEDVEQRYSPLAHEIAAIVLEEMRKERPSGRRAGPAPGGIGLVGRRRAA